MDAFDIDNVKAEKAKALLKFNRLRTIANLFRLVEIFLVVVLLSWISSRLPFLVKISSDYFRRLIALILSPLFIFLITNAIVITLLAKSGRIFRRAPTGLNNAETDFYEEFINISQTGPGNPPPVPEPEPIVYDDKEIISELISVAPKGNEEIEIAAVRASEFKIFERSKSEKLMKRSLEKTCGKLRRSETEICRKVADSGEDPASVVEELSNEEFQRTIEEFIAKQVKFHKQEILAIVPVNPNQGIE